MEFFQISENNRKLIYKNIKIGLEAYESFIYENRKYFLIDPVKDISLLGRIKTFAINRQFYNASFEKDGLEVILKKTNKFGNITLFVFADNNIFTISKIPKNINKLYIDDSAKYKRILALNNSDIIPTQLSFFENKQKSEKFKYYGQINYDWNNGNLQSLEIVVPSDNMERCLTKINILKDVSTQEDFKEIFEKSYEEEIVTLKQNLIDKFNKKDVI